MSTERTPVTALSGGHRPEDSLAISTAILAVPYAVFQADSFDESNSSGVISLGSQAGETKDNAMALVEAARVLGSFSLGRWNAASCLFMYSAGGAGARSLLGAGVEDDKAFF